MRAQSQHSDSHKSHTADWACVTFNAFLALLNRGLGGVAVVALVANGAFSGALCRALPSGTSLTTFFSFVELKHADRARLATCRARSRRERARRTCDTFIIASCCLAVSDLARNTVASILELRSWRAAALTCAEPTFTINPMHQNGKRQDTSRLAHCTTKVGIAL